MQITKIRGVQLPKREEARLKEIAETNYHGSPLSIAEASTRRLGERGFVNIALGRAYISEVGTQWLLDNVGSEEQPLRVNLPSESETLVAGLKNLLEQHGYVVTITRRAL